MRIGQKVSFIRRSAGAIPIKLATYAIKGLPSIAPNGIAKRVVATSVNWNSTNAFTDFINMVGLNGIEPLTSDLSGLRSSQLSYKPIIS